MQLVEIAAYQDHYMPTIPAQPTELTSHVTSHDVRLSWKFASDGRSALLGTTITLRNQDGYVIAKSVNGTETDLLVQHLPAGEWTAIIQGRNSIGQGDPATSNVFQVGRSGANTVNDSLPVSRQPKAELVVDTSSVTVTWHAVNLPDDDDECGYNITLTPEDSSLDSRIAWIRASSKTTFTFESVAKGTYTASVQTTDGKDRVSAKSAPSEPIVVATVPAQPNKPGVTSSDDVMDITWKAPADGGTAITSYALTLRNLTENNVSVVKAAPDELTKQVKGLAPGNYTASIIAINQIGMSTESSPSLPCLIK